MHFFRPYPDDRLVSILRHRSFLKELQEIALRGESLPAELTFAHVRRGRSISLFIPSLGEERAEQDGGEDAPDVTTPTSEADIPGELSIHSYTEASTT